MNLNKLFLNKNIRKNVCGVLSLMLCSGLTSNIVLADEATDISGKTTKYIAYGSAPDYNVVPGQYYATMID